MKPWTRLNMLLAIAAAILWALTWQSAPDDGHSRLTDLDPADITAIRVERGDQLRLHLRREPRGWIMHHPQQGAAALSRVQQLLAIAQAPVVRSFALQAPMSQYGTDNPEARITLDDTRLSFGSADPSGRNRYVLGGGRIHVIDDLFFKLLALPASHFLEP